MNTAIKGAKAGSGEARKAVIAPDSAQSKTYIKVLYGLSEGEVEGLANGLQSVYLEETPLQNPAGGSNFEGVISDFRYGTNDQTHIEGFPDIVSESGVNVELKSDAPWVRAISNTDLDAVNIRFKWGALRQTNSDNGDVNGYTIQYAIDLQTDGGTWAEVLNTKISDKTSTNYERSHRIDLPNSDTGWTIRARRITPNSDSEYISDKMYVDAITDVIDLKLSYPNTALLGLQYDAETFSNVAKVAVDLKGIKIQVPSNYDPVARTYTGMWDGTFKRAYTNNPAWIYYDICTAKRYALGDRLTSTMLDKWSLYRLAQYCDQKVSDGKGGEEPRFTCNVYLQSTEDAYSILSKLSGVFRAISYWDGNSIVCDADIPQDTYFTYTKANVIDGHFEYSGTRARDRHTVAKVAWDNPANHYKTEYVFVRDEAAIAKLGVRIAEIDAWGCTSEGQAQRAGLWALKSEQLETRSVSFKVGLDGYIPQPGKVIEIADELFAGRANGGRISAVSANRKIITLDRDDVVCRAGDRLVVNGEDGRAQARIVSSKIGRNVTVTIAFDSVAAENVWVVDAQDLKTMKFRVMSITQDEKHQFSITALQYESAKYDAIDFGAFIDERPISIINPTIQAPVDSVAITSENMVQQGLSVATMIIAWPQVTGATKYQVEWRKDDGSWIKLPITGNNSVEVQGVYSGNYEARVIAINAFDAASLPAYSLLTAISGKQGLPPKLAFIQATGKLFGFELNWGFPATGALDTAYTEIRIASTANGANAAQLGLFAYPTTTHSINGAQPNLTQWFSGRLIDRIGNIGEWSAWASATTSADASAILDILGGKISASELNKALQTKINKIDSIAGLDGDIGNLVEDFSALQTTVSSINNGLAQEAIDRLAAIKLLDDGFTQEKLDRRTDDAQITGLITNYKQSSDTSLANVRQKAEAAVSASSANSELITTLDSRTLIAEGNAAAAKANAATALDKATTATTQSAATAEKVEQVRAIANQAADGTDLASQTSATALQKATASAQTSSANAEKIASLEVNLGTKASTGALAQTNATVAEIDGRVIAGTTKLDGVYAQVNAKMIGSSDDLIGGDGGYAATWTLQSAIIEGDTQQAERIDTTLVKVADNLAAIQNEAQVRLTADSAISYRVDTVQANFENNRAIVQQQIIAISNEQGSSVQKFEQLEAKAESAQDSADSASIQAAAAEAAAKSYAKSQADAAREAAALDATAKADAAEAAAVLVANAAKAAADNAALDATNKSKSAEDAAKAYALAQAKAAEDAATATASDDATAKADAAEAAAVAAAALDAKNKADDAKQAAIDAAALDATTKANAAKAAAKVLSDAAQKAADDARLVADNATIKLSDISSDEKLTPNEKQQVKLIRGEIDRTHAEIIKQAQVYSLSTTAYLIKYNALSAYISPLLSSMSTTSDVVQGTFQANFADYYSARAVLGNAISTSAKKLADEAQLTASAAQQAAGNKGEVIFGSTTPVSEKRLPQNLWIDTTGSANTPKRWNGSAWVVVTDKAATDAAAAATAAKLEAEEATRNIATIKIEQGGFANKLDAASGEIKTIQTRLSGQTDSIEVVNAVGNLEALKISLAKDRLDKDVTKLQAKTTTLNALTASIDEKISGLNAKKQKPDITPEETSLLNSQISELNGAKTDANTQKNDIAAQVLQINNEKSQLNSLVVTESKIKAQSTIKIDAGGKIYGYGLAVEESGGTNYSDFIIRSDSFALAAPYVQGQAEKATSFPFIYRLTPFTDPITGTVFPVGAYMKSASMDYQSVKTSHIEDLAVKSAQIDDLAVTSAKIKDAAITTAKIGDLQVDSAKIANSSITTAKIGDLQVDTLKIKDDAVTVSVAAQNISNLSIITTGGKVRVNLGLSYYYAVNGGDASNRLVIRVYRNNALIRTYSLRPTAIAITSIGSEGGSGSIATAFFSYTQELPMIVDAVAAGTYTYSITLSDPRFNGVYEAAYLMESIALMEVKK